MKRIYILATVVLINFGMVNAQNNPLLGTFNTPHEAAPFNQIKTESYFHSYVN